MAVSHNLEPINYVERIGDLTDRFWPFCISEARALAKYLGPGSLPIHRRNDARRRLHREKRPREKDLEAEIREFRAAAGRPFPQALNLDLPRPVRGQNTFGYSWVAFNYAAVIAGCAEPTFSVDALESVVDSGVELLNHRTSSWREQPQTFIEEIDKWKPFEWDISDIPVLSPIVAPAARHDYAWRPHVVMSILLERTHERMLLWNELRYWLDQMRSAGLHGIGLDATLQIAMTARIRHCWEHFEVCASQIVSSVTWSLADAYACSIGKGLVKREERCACHMKERRGEPMGWRLRSHLSELMTKNYYAGVLARYCLTDGYACCGFRETITSATSRETQLLMEQQLLQHPDKAAELPTIIQDLMSEKNMAMDLYYSVVAAHHKKFLASVKKPDLTPRPRVIHDRIDVYAKLEALAHTNEMMLDGWSSCVDLLFDGNPEQRVKLAERHISTFALCWTQSLHTREYMVWAGISGLRTATPLDIGDEYGPTLMHDPRIPILEIEKEVSLALDADVGYHLVNLSTTAKIGWLSNHMRMQQKLNVNVRPAAETTAQPRHTKRQPTAIVGEQAEKWEESFPLSSEPLGQSSRKYLQEAGFWEDVKGKKAQQITQPAERSAPKSESMEALDLPILYDIYQVNARQWKLVKKLFARDADTSGGSVRWDELDKLIRRLGFTVELRGGSVTSWIPPRIVGLPINVHRPHPESSIGPVKCKVLAERLRRKYGWTIESFSRKVQVDPEQ